MKVVTAGMSYSWSSLEELQKKAMHEGLVGKEARTGHMNDY